MFFICFLVIGLGVVSVVLLGLAMFVSVAFRADGPKEAAVMSDAAEFELSDSRVLQIMRDRSGRPVVSSFPSIHA